MGLQLTYYVICFTVVVIVVLSLFIYNLLESHSLWKPYSLWLLLKPSIIVLILTNLYPLYGLISLGWDVFTIIFIYWIETIFLFILLVFKNIIISFDNRSYKSYWSGDNLRMMMMIVGFFFAIMYMYFFVVWDFYFDDELNFINFVSLWTSAVTTSIFLLCLSHSLSFFMNFIVGKEYRGIPSGILSRSHPFNRIILLTLVIFGGFIIIFIFDSTWLLGVFMVLIKIIIDLRGHLQEHNYFVQINNRS